MYASAPRYAVSGQEMAAYGAIPAPPARRATINRYGFNNLGADAVQDHLADFEKKVLKDPSIKRGTVRYGMVRYGTVCNHNPSSSLLKRQGPPHSKPCLLCPLTRGDDQEPPGP